mmetsp:Transcript_109569/g.251254  ORF Transcript_109569/g.251254 Transcript_109569/m.251254 type:complete len:309 (+) Transcript_109569:33-959(+)
MSIQRIITGNQWFCDDSASTADSLQRQPLLIFDFDDTLFPTSWLVANQRSTAANCASCPRLVHRLEEVVVHLLKLAAGLGRVAIVTNAQQGMVKRSLEAWMPGAAALLAHLDVEVIYAQEVYAQQQARAVSTKRSCAWRLPKIFRQNKIEEFETPVDHFTLCKVVAMDNLLHRHFGSGPCAEVVCIGDSFEEIRAINRSMSRRILMGCEQHRIKTVKMMSQPTCSALMAQLSVLSQTLPALVRADASKALTLKLSETLVRRHHLLQESASIWEHRVGKDIRVFGQALCDPATCLASPGSWDFALPRAA